MANARPYRPDIEGLRAFAVLAVILNHAYPTFLHSGFLGVDVFFVISGYVITLSLLSARESGAVAFFLDFYTRRVKRIAPALLVCIAVTASVLYLIDPNPRASFGTGIYALFGAANIFLYFEQLDYFATDISFNAFMHMWSLGVEEQFYLLLPMLVWLVRPTRYLAFGLCLTAALSLALFILGHPDDPLGTFYLLPSRFWELAAGAVLATLQGAGPRPSGKPGFLSLQTLFLCLVVTGTIVASHLVQWQTLLVVLATMAVIATPDRSPLLTNRVATYLGKLSYSLYLWHWPLLVFKRLAPEALWATDPVLAAILLAVAMMSFHVIENPLRHRIWSTRRWTSLAYGAAGSALVIIGLMAIQTSLQPADRRQLQMRPDSPAWEDAFLMLPNGKTYNPTCVVSEPDRPLRKETFADCTFPSDPDSNAPMVWAMGDSTAGQFQSLFVQLHAEYGLGFHLVETPGIQFPDISANGGFAPRKVLYAEIRKHLAAGDTIFLSRLYLQQGDLPRILDGMENWLAALESFTTEMDKLGVQVIVAGPIPAFRFTDIRTCPRDNPSICDVPREPLAKLAFSIESSLDAIAARHPNFKQIKIFDLLCPAGSKVCSPMLDGHFIMRDLVHLDIIGASMASPQLLKLLGLSPAAD